MIPNLGYPIRLHECFSPAARWISFMCCRFKFNADTIASGSFPRYSQVFASTPARSQALPNGSL